MAARSADAIEWRTDKPVRIENEPLLDAVYRGEDTESEYELERRYLPARLLPVAELERLSNGQMREITQGYIEAVDAKGETIRFRLRSTFQKGEEGLLYRVARKLKIVDSTAKVEKQLKFAPHDADAADFEYLWKRYVPDGEILSKTRYYINHALHNGHACEIHYDIHHGKRFGEFARIEIEFKGDSADADHQYVLDHGASVLPDWIGPDVSGDKRYGGSDLAKHGPPQEAVHAQQMLRTSAR